MFDGAVAAPSLFPSLSFGTSNKCKRDNIIHAGQADWMKWQAGYACAACLMPLTAWSSSTQARCNGTRRYLFA